MTWFPLIAALMAGAAVTIATALGWSIAVALRPLVSRLRWPARYRAMVLAQVRLLPLALPALLLIAQCHAFVRYEQARPESAGPLLIVLGALGFVLSLEALYRLGLVWRRTASVAAGFRHDAKPIALAGWDGRAWATAPTCPPAVVIGPLGVELFISAPVLHHCTADELAAIVAHERAHVIARDNLLMLLFAVTPGARLLRVIQRVAVAYETEWSAASEEAADQSAGDVAGHLELASALTKVVRLGLLRSSPIPASALIGESELNRRVLRLIRTSQPPQRVLAAWLPAVLVLGTALVSHLPAVGAVLHEAFELLVRSH
jgi:Zn-dependent protease with chaperone function